MDDTFPYIYAHRIHRIRCQSNDTDDVAHVMGIALPSNERCRYSADTLNIHTANLADGTGLIRIIRRVNKSTRLNNMGLQRDIACMAHTNARLPDTRD